MKSKTESSEKVQETRSDKEVEPSRILVIDDEKNIRRTLGMVLEGEGYQVSDAASAAEAATLFSTGKPPSAVLLDIKLGDDNGLDVLEAIKAGVFGLEAGCDPNVPIIMISGHASISDAVRATRLGAFDFLEKPLDRNRVVVCVRNAVERSAIATTLELLRNKVDSQFEILGTSKVVDELRRQIARVAPTKSRVLVTGESGTGKELVARALHQQSSVANGGFVKVNCAAIPPELIESELFGHEKGSFTGAVQQRRGLFEVAQGGTIFLDEIGDMALGVQAKVLRVLQTGDYNRVGGEVSLTTDCRVIAATNKDLAKAVEDGEFREDLFFRLNVFPIHSPPLRDRIDDLPLLLSRFVDMCCNENGFATKAIDPEVLTTLSGYAWPGNIRELRNVAERLVIMSDEVVSPKDLPAYLGGPARPLETSASQESIDLEQYADMGLREFREHAETAFINRRLKEHDWNISKTAQSLGIERTNLHKKLRSLGIHRP